MPEQNVLPPVDKTAERTKPQLCRIASESRIGQIPSTPKPRRSQRFIICPWEVRGPAPPHTTIETFFNPLFHPPQSGVSHPTKRARRSCDSSVGGACTPVFSSRPLASCEHSSSPFASSTVRPVTSPRGFGNDAGGSDPPPHWGSSSSSQPLNHQEKLVSDDALTHAFLSTFCSSLLRRASLARGMCAPLVGRCARVLACR